jgi:hypothetical protein
MTTLCEDLHAFKNILLTYPAKWSSKTGSISLMIVFKYSCVPVSTDSVSAVTVISGLLRPEN